LSSYRLPIDSFVQSQTYQALFPEPSAQVMKIRFRHALEAIRPELSERFVYLQARWREGLAAEDKRKALNAEIVANNMSWDGLREGFAEEYWVTSQQVRIAQLQCEISAEQILLTLDGIVTTLVQGLTGKDEPLGVGLELIAGVRLDNLLDAAGNYTRHRSEWLAAMRAQISLSRRQLASINRLGKVLSGNPSIAGLDAANTLMSSPYPMVAALDVIADYASRGDPRAMPFAGRVDH